MTGITQVVAKTIRLEARLSNAVINFSEMTGSIVAIVAETDRDTSPVTGFGFGSIGRYAQTEMILERFAPRLLASDPTDYCDTTGQPDPIRMQPVLRRNEKPGGHGERSVAVGAIDMAAWDLVGKLEEKPLFQVLRERFSPDSPGRRTEVYAAGGYYHDGRDLDGLRNELSGYLDSGYRKVKIKIGGGSLKADLERIDAAIEVVGDPARIAVDANGRFQMDDALAWGRAIEPYSLRWYEEAGNPIDYEIQRALAECYPHPIATGENLFAAPEVLNLMRYGGMRPDRDVLQMDPGLSYGLPEYLRMLETLDIRGWNRQSCFPHGGNLFNLHVAAGLGLGGTEAYPGIFAPFGGFGEDVRIVDGRAMPPDLPGIGWDTKPELRRLFLDLI